MVFDELLKLLSYPIMQRALIVGIPVALCSALLGVSLVLKRYSMIGDGLSHVSFGALAIAAALNMTPIYFAVPVVTVAAVFLLRISSNSKINGDSAIAIISSSALAIGVMIATLSQGMNVDFSSYLFGSILAINPEDAVMSIVLSIVVIVLFIFFYHKIFAVTFDEGFTKATGTNSGVYNMIIAVLTALTIVIGMRIMGMLLISSLIIFPAVTSMRLCKTFKSVIICSSILSVGCFVAGMLVSYMWSTPAGSTVVVINLCAFLLFTLISAVKKK